MSLADTTNTPPPRDGLSLFDRLTARVIPLFVLVLPWVVAVRWFRRLDPNETQSYIFILTVFPALGVLALAWLLRWRPSPGRVTVVFGLLALLGLSFVVSLPWHQEPLYSLHQALLPICGVGFFALLVSQPDRNTLLRRLGLALVLLGVSLALYGIAQHFGYEFIPYRDEIKKNRVIATIGHPNYLSSVLGPIVFVILGFIFTRHNLRWVLGGGVLIFILLFCVALGGTRAVWLGVSVGMLVVIALGVTYCVRHRVGLKWVYGLGIGTLLALLALAIAIFYFLPAMDRSIDVIGRIRSEREIISRLFYWRAAIDIGMSHPLLGIGYARFDPEFWDYVLGVFKTDAGPFYYDMFEAVSGPNPGHVHNEYLETFAEQGMLGLSALMGLIGFFLFFGWSAILREPSPRRAFWGICFYGAFVMTLVDAFFGFPWRLPISLMVVMIVLAGLYEMIHPSRDAATGAAPR